MESGEPAAAPVEPAPLQWPELDECAQLALRSYAVLARNFAAFLLFAAPWVVILVAAVRLLHMSGESRSLIVVLLGICGGSAVAVGVHRVILLGERPFAAMRPRPAMLAFAAICCVAFVFALVAVVAFYALCGLLSVEPGEGAIPYVEVPSFLLFLSRHLLVFPALAVEDPRMTLRRALRRPKMPVGAPWNIFVGTIVAGFPVMWLDVLIPDSAATVQGQLLLRVVSPLLVFGMAALVAGYSSALYRRVGIGA